MKGRPARRLCIRLLRLGRLFLGRNKLRRPCDRIEGTVIVVLLAVFFTASVWTACFAGHLYHSQRAAAARLSPAVAVLNRPGPTAGGQTTAVPATWQLPDGAVRWGTLTGVTAPGIYGASAGTWVKVWLDRSGQPVAPPLSWWDVFVSALLAGFIAIAAAALALILCYWLCRRALDRHRAAKWELAWAVVGPQWTSRR